MLPKKIIMHKFFVSILLLFSLLSIDFPLFAQQESVAESAEVSLSQEQASQAQTQEKAESIFGFKMAGSNDQEEVSVNQKSQAKQPISIIGDTVEYSLNSKDVIAAGNVEIIYKGAKLTCQKITVNTDTKEGLAQGNVRLDDAGGVIEADKMNYNFGTQAGVMIDAGFRANPYFGKAEKMKKNNEIEFIGFRTQMSTCSYDNPHYRIKSRKVNFLIGEKVTCKDNLFTVGQKQQFPLFYLPEFNRSLKEPYMHVQFSPGQSKAWGKYMLTAWRYNISENISGDILLDYRTLLGVAEGFITNVKTDNFGKGEFKFYYTQERDKSKDLSSSVDVPKVFERYLIRWRHRWDVSPVTNIITEYHRMEDSKMMIHGSGFNLMKEYFFREYEKDALPLSYMQLQHLFSNSSFNLVVQPRVNRWTTQLEKLPELTYVLPATQIAQTPFYLEDLSSFANYDTLNGIPSSGARQLNMTRFDTYNKISAPVKLSIFQFSPFVADRLTYYNDAVDGSSIAPRTVFYSGADLTTKFYKVLNVKTNFFGLDVNGLRHIITPTLSYLFNNKPTIANSKLKQIDGIDSIAVTNSASFGLQNKLQTKRNNTTVDLLDFRINNTYTFRSSANKSGGKLSDFLLYLDLIPYSWLSLHSDVTFSRQEHKFSTVNADLNFCFTAERSIGIGERYVRRGSKETILNLIWRLNPKWKFNFYGRYQFGNATNLSKGLREQQYTIIRDLHCWTTEFMYDVDKTRGHNLWLIFRLKAFPELQFEYDQEYHRPKPGSQNYGKS